MVEGLEHVDRFPVLFAELLRRGTGPRRIFVRSPPGIVLRALREVERVAAELQQTRSPSTADLRGVGAR